MMQIKSSIIIANLEIKLTPSKWFQVIDLLIQFPQDFFFFKYLLEYCK